MKRKLLILLIFILGIVPIVFALPTLQPSMLSWTAPTTNVDGSPLTNLAGYKVYWKSSSVGSYTNSQSKDVGNILTIPIVNVTGSATTIYYFVVTAYNTTGGEGGFSNEVRNSVPLVPAVPGNLGIQ